MVRLRRLTPRADTKAAVTTDDHAPLPIPVTPTALARPAHPLDCWLSTDLARVSPPDAPSRLRQLADVQGTLAAAWSSAIGGGSVLVLGGAFASVMSAHPSWVLLLGVAGAMLAALGVVSWKRVRARLPLILLVAWILVPSVVLGRARQSFRRRVEVNPVLRAAVEDDLATWRDPHGDGSYGPL